LDVGGDDMRQDVLELREAGAELDGLARPRRELARDHLVPLAVEPPQDRALAPCSLLVRERRLEAHRRSHANVTYAARSSGSTRGKIVRRTSDSPGWRDSAAATSRWLEGWISSGS